MWVSILSLNVLISTRDPALTRGCKSDIVGLGGCGFSAALITHKVSLEIKMFPPPPTGGYSLLANRVGDMSLKELEVQALPGLPSVPSSVVSSRKTPRLKGSLLCTDLHPLRSQLPGGQ